MKAFLFNLVHPFRDDTSILLVIAENCYKAIERINQDKWHIEKMTEIHTTAISVPRETNDAAE